MTKTISLADDAYEALVGQKRPEESFSDLARRLARDSARRHLFDRDRPRIWSDEEEAELIRKIYAARDEPARTVT